MIKYMDTIHLQGTIEAKPQYIATTLSPPKTLAVSHPLTRRGFILFPVY